MFFFFYLYREHSQSYYSFLWKHLYQHVDIRKENINILDGNAPDLDEECRRYEAAIVKVGGIELFVGGIGPGKVYNCHQGLYILTL